MNPVIDFDALDKLVEECPYDTKLAVTRWVFENIVNHARQGGSYRYLIYDRLGFDLDAYVPLCDDGLTISNEFDLDMKGKLIKAFKEDNKDDMKKLLGLCDEPGCFNESSCGFPTENGYRMTCYDHMKKSPNNEP